VELLIHSSQKERESMGGNRTTVVRERFPRPRGEMKKCNAKLPLTHYLLGTQGKKRQSRNSLLLTVMNIFKENGGKKKRGPEKGSGGNGTKIIDVGGGGGG